MAVPQIKGAAMAERRSESAAQYEAPALVVLGTLQELTLADCVDKAFGPTDGHTLMGVSITCSSA
jgi:hypothetical protein